MEIVTPKQRLNHHKSETMSISGKNVHVTPEIEVLLDGNLNFAIKVFTWGLANNHGTCKKYEKLAEHIILSNSI